MVSLWSTQMTSVPQESRICSDYRSPGTTMSSKTVLKNLKNRRWCTVSYSICSCKEQTKSQVFWKVSTSLVKRVLSVPLIGFNSRRNFILTWMFLWWPSKWDLDKKRISKIELRQQERINRAAWAPMLEQKKKSLKGWHRTTSRMKSRWKACFDVTSGSMQTWYRRSLVSLERCFITTHSSKSERWIKISRNTW